MTATSPIAISEFDRALRDDFTELIERAKNISLESLSEAPETDRPDLFPAQTFEKIRSAGLLKAVMPKSYGGAGLGIEAGTTLHLLTLLKYLGYGNLVVGRIFEGHYNAWQLICEYGTAGQIEKLTGESLQQNHLFGVWNTEASDGVKIVPDGKNKYRLEGSKIFASGVGYVNRPVVTGRLAGGGWQMCLVPMEKISTNVDDSWWKPLGMQASRSYRVDFSGVEISSEDLIGGPDDYYRQPFFSGGAIRFAAVQLGAAELLLDLMRDFLRELHRAGDPFQQMRAGEMAIAVESGNLWLAGAARSFDDYLYGKEKSQIEQAIHYAGMMRAAIEQICQNVMLGCERSIGSRGLMKPYHFERVIRDLTTYLRQAAPDATLTGIGDFVFKSEKRAGDLWHRSDE